MTGQDWLSSDDPAAMLRWLCPGPAAGPGAVRTRIAPPSDRKLRLFAAACCRAVWDRLTDPRARRAVEVAERYADGRATEADLRKHHEGSFYWMGWPYASSHSAADTAAEAAHFFRETYRQAPAAQAALLRDVFGNPFRPVRLLYRQGCPPACRVTSTPRLEARGGPLRVCGGCGYPWECPWLTPTVPSVARRAYDERDFAALPLLADALEEAGCGEEALLMHLRGRDRCPCLGVPCCALSEGADPRWREAHTCAACRGVGWAPLVGPHARGCWALDLVLGRD